MYSMVPKVYELFNFHEDGAFKCIFVFDLLLKHDTVCLALDYIFFPKRNGQWYSGHIFFIYKQFLRIGLNQMWSWILVAT